MKKIFVGRRGMVLITFALLLTVLFGFLALAVEVGHWYLVRSELSKSADAAALAGAANLSNPFVSAATIAQEIGEENFRSGYIGTPTSGQGAVSFIAESVGSDKIQTSASTSISAVLSRLFGIDQVSTGTGATAQKKEVEIMLVLDRSGSMQGRPISDLKTAAKSFLDFFQDTQDHDKAGLISFATGVTMNRAMATNFVNAMKTAINGMAATGGTNMEDAIAQTMGTGGFTDQTGVPGDRRIQQFLVLFTDGNPTAFRGTFRRNSTNYDAVVAGTGQTCDTVWTNLGKTNSEQTWDFDPTPTGDGTNQKRWTDRSPRRCGSGDSLPSTRWNVFTTYAVAGYGPTDCVPESVLAPYICTTARSMAVTHAGELKARYVKIYTIGLGNVDQAFLQSISSGSGYYYYTPDSAELEAIFQKIAKQIKLRLVG